MHDAMKQERSVQRPGVDDPRVPIIGSNELAMRLNRDQMFRNWRFLIGFVLLLMPMLITVVSIPRNPPSGASQTSLLMSGLQFGSFLIGYWMMVWGLKREGRRQRPARENVMCPMCSYVIMSPRPDVLPDEIACPKCGRRFTGLQYEMHFPRMWSRMP